MSFINLDCDMQGTLSISSENEEDYNCDDEIECSYSNASDDDDCNSDDNDVNSSEKKSYIILKEDELDKCEKN